MGQGYSYVCRKCHHPYDVHLGIGMLFSKTYCDKLIDIAAGAYGEDLRELLETTDNATFDGSKYVFVCDSCKRWITDIDATLWVPNGPEGTAAYTGGRWKNGYVRAKGSTLCPTSWDLHTYFHVLKRHTHVCEACGQPMHKATGEELNHLSCPRCGTPNSPCGFINWD